MGEMGSQETTEEQQTENKTISRKTLPVKAQYYLARTERNLLSKISNALGVPRIADRQAIQRFIEEISDEY